MTEQGGVQTRFATLVQAVVVTVFAAAAAYYVGVSLHWRLMVDSPVMHYVVFLMRHGMKPYSDISDNNMPGSYMTEALAMRVFGTGDMGWRLYEYFVLAVMTACLVTLAGKRHRLGGVFAAGMFVVLHSAEGPQFAVEREEIITMLLLVSFVLLFAAVQWQQPLLLLPWGLVCGMAASIKPTYLPLPLAELAMALFVLRRQGVGWGRYLLWAVCGLGAMGLIDLGFLVHYRALAGFGFILRHVLPAYGGLLKMTWGHLISLSLPRMLYVQLPIVALLAAMNYRRLERWDWKRWALLVAAGFGLASFLIQRKGFPHHRYTLLVFLLLLMGMETAAALREQGWPRMIAALLLLFNCGYVAPRTLMVTRQVVGHTEFELSLERDLGQLGGAAQLQGKVQCFDLVFGCLNALYHLDMVENTGFTGDLFFFSGTRTVASRYYRERFWELAWKDPATVMVISNQHLTESNSFDKTDAWPEFEAYLRDRYTEVVERRFPYEHFSTHYDHPPPPYYEQDAYRIYVLKDSPLAESAGERLSATAR